MSGAVSFSQASRCSSRCRTELTFQVAMRMVGAGPQVGSAGERAGRPPGHGAGPRRRQIEKLVPQPQDAVALGLLTRNEAPIRSSTKSTSEPARNGTEAGSTSTTASSRAITRSSSGLGALDVEFVLEAGAAAALDADAQHGAIALGPEDFADAAGGPLGDGDVALVIVMLSGRGRHADIANSFGIRAHRHS